MPYGCGGSLKMLNSVGKNDMSKLIDFADIGPIPEPTIWTKPPLDLDALEAKITGLTPQWPLPGPAEKAMRELIEEVRKLRAEPSPQPRQWGPWISWAGGECPIPDANAGEYDLQFVDGKPCSVVHKIGASTWNWRTRDVMLPITAYRVLLPTDDLLRQAVEALRMLQTGLSRTKNGMYVGVNLGELAKLEAVLALADERGR